MSAPTIPLWHIAPRARGIGGIETLLARHAAVDRAAGFDAWQVGLFDRAPAAEERFCPMAFGWRDTPSTMRRAMRQALAGQTERAVVWHNAWGLPWFSEFDRATRRVVVLHAHRSYFEQWLPSLRVFIDGIVAVSPAIVRDAAQLLPGWPEERIVFAPLPIEPMAGEETRARRDGVWVLGCAGRLARPQKRWDRLVPFVSELRRLGVRFRLEIIGDGPLRPWLEKQFAGDSAVTFLGFTEREEYWRRLRSWDAALFFSEVEGGPIVLLEAMAAGALPIYPAIGGSAGDDYAPRIDRNCYYPAGDASAAARGLESLLRLPESELTEKRAAARTIAQTHLGSGYEDAFANFVRRIVSLPRVSRSEVRRSRWTDALPLGLITRAMPRELWR
jgi:glycosyltransferase involved in cell wall biosynthesis